MFVKRLLLLSILVVALGLSGWALAQDAATNTQVKPGIGEVASPVAIPDDVRLEIEAIQTYYMDTGNFTVDFTQNYHSKMTHRVKSSTGRVDFAQPMKMRWEYDTPSRRSFITDGKSLWVVMWEDKEVKLHKDLRSSDLESSVAFLWGGRDIAERYQVTRLKLETLENTIPVKGRTVLELIPTKDKQFDTLYLLVDPKTHRIEEVAIIDQLGNLNHMVFNSPQTGKTFKPGHFSFTPPDESWSVVTVDF